MMLLLYFIQSTMQVKKEEIPYSEFQEYLAEDQITECVIGEKFITGALNLIDEKSGKPRHFIIVRFHDSDLANALVKHGVKYSVAIESHLLRNLFFNLILLFGLIFLLWGFVSRKMGPAGMNFMNIGKNKAHIHAENQLKVTFEDVAGVDEAKQELGEVIDRIVKIFQFEHPRLLQLALCIKNTA